MFRNYLITALRHLRRHPGYTALNVVGLALGFGVSILLLTLAWALLSFDRFHDRAEDVHLAFVDGGFWQTATTWAPLKEALEQDFPVVQSATRLYTAGHRVSVPDAGGAAGTEAARVFQEEVTYVDAGFLEVFTFPLVQGDAQTALAQPDGAVLTAAAAGKYFGRTDIVGRTLLLDGRSSLVVTGVMEDVPATSHLQPSIVASYAHAAMNSGLIRSLEDNWDNNYVRTYLRLQPGARPEVLEAQFPDFLTTYRREASQPDFGLKLVPLVDLADQQGGTNTYARALILLALGILALATINFMNMATARSLERAREIGVRKVLGAHRGSLAGQFLSESTIVALVALVLGIALAQALAPGFNRLREGLLDVQLDFGNPVLWLGLLGLGLVVGFVSGSYPALFLSRFRPHETLKGRLSSRPAGARLRSSLVVVQFAITAFLIAGTVVMNRQMQFVQDEGFDFGREPLVVVPISEHAFEVPEQGLARLQTYAQELTRSPHVASVTVSSAVPGSEYWQTARYSETPGADEADLVPMHPTGVDDAYFDVYGVALLDGRAPSHEREVALNESAAQALGWAQPVGQTLYRGDEALEVVGLAEDVHVASLREPLRPDVYHFLPEASTDYRYLTVRSAGSDAAPPIAAMSTLWPTLDLAQGFTYFYGDDYYAQALLPERAVTKVVTFAAFFALLVAVLGLVGMGALSAAQRTKEIGVRKVMGASVASVALLLVRRFALLVAMALAIGFPLALYAVGAWLDTFAYRIDLGPGLFVLTAALVLGAALLAVGWQAVRAASADPAQSLRYE